MRKLSATFQEFGYFDGGCYLLSRLLQRARSKLKIISYKLVVQQTWRRELIADRIYGRYSVREIVESDDAILKKMPVEWGVLQSRFQQRARCLGLFYKEALVGYAWTSLHCYEEDELRITFELPDDRAVFDFDVFIFPDYRAGRAFAVLWEAVNRTLKRERIECSYSRISCFNSQSQRSHRQLGAVSVGRILALKRGQRQIIVSTLKPHLRVLWRSTDRFVVRLPRLSAASEEVT